VSEPEAVTRARRISPGPHLSVLSLRDHPTNNTREEGVDGVAPVDAQNAPTSRWKTRTERGFPTDKMNRLASLVTW